ncbi:hypothetical protein F5Y05DRAFT_421440 [Hypoxylon sp. FL0543]|nr:hypothetical protein F5Y05DRAFT_421440 [Hypoxylon sp. FL0543]
MTAIPDDQQRNYEIFRDCLSTALIEKISQPQSKPKRKPRSSRKPSSASAPPAPATPHTTTSPENGDADAHLSNADDLAEFADYIAAETFQALPNELKTLDHHAYAKNTALQARYALPLTGAAIPSLLPALDPAVADSLAAYGVTREPAQGVDEFLAPVLTSYLTTLSTAAAAAPRHQGRGRGARLRAVRARLGAAELPSPDPAARAR